MHEEGTLQDPIPIAWQDRAIGTSKVPQIHLLVGSQENMVMMNQENSLKDLEDFDLKEFGFAPHERLDCVQRKGRQSEY